MPKKKMNIFYGRLTCAAQSPLSFCSLIFTLWCFVNLPVLHKTRLYN